MNSKINGINSNGTGSTGSAETNIFSNRLFAAAIAIFCCILWGSATPAIKTAYTLFQIPSDDIMSRFLLAGVRFAGAGIIIIAYGSISAGKFIHPSKETQPLIMKLGMVQTVFQYVFFYTGLAHTTGIKSAVLSATSTFFAIIISAMFRLEKLDAKKVSGCAVGLLGVIIINLNGSRFGPLNFAGDGAILINAVANALAAVLIKKYSARENPVVLTGYQFLFGGLILALAGLVGGGKLSAVGPSAWLLMFYMMLLSSAAYTLWTVLLKYNSVSEITIFSFCTPVFGVLLSALLLKETNTFSPLQCAVSLILVSAGILTVNLKGKTSVK